jgi:hypothetical protein
VQAGFALAASALRIAAPWLAAIFGILAAVVAERAFRTFASGSSPDSLGDQAFFPTEIAARIEERGIREGLRHEAPAQQGAVTYLAAGAAMEAAAASQSGLTTTVIALAGIAVAVGPPLWRWRNGRRAAAEARANAVFAAFMVENKILFTGDRRHRGYAAFVKAHPNEAKLLGIVAAADANRDSPPRVL